jgi:hypothetical protein
MGIQAAYRRVAPSDFERMIQDHAFADEFFGANIGEKDIEAREEFRKRLAESGAFFDVGKDWDAIHFLVTGVTASQDANQVDLPFCNLILGGNPTWWEANFGVVRYLMPDEVKELSEAVDKVPAAEIESRLNVRSFCDAGLYPLNKNWSRHAIDLVPPVLEALKNFLRETAKRGDVLLLSLN